MSPEAYGSVMVKVEFGRRRLGWVEPSPVHPEMVGFHYIGGTGELASCGLSYWHHESKFEQPSTPEEVLKSLIWKNQIRRDSLTESLDTVTADLAALRRSLQILNGDDQDFDWTTLAGPDYRPLRIEGSNS